jgi:starch phosphorylase
MRSPPVARASLPRALPKALVGLAELALDLRWTWSHAGDALWRKVSPELWDRLRNPWVLLQDVPSDRLAALARDTAFRAELQQLLAGRARYMSDRGWYGRTPGPAGPRCVAYFSMEFGLGEALPLYAGGLGILAGDYLKTASDSGLPAVGVGLLYQVGYFRQVVDAAGRQQELYPYNDPTSLPIQPVLASAGGWLHVPVELPGRILQLRVWQARVGRVVLYLLDSNDPVNSPADRAITGELYGGGPELRLTQELALGIGGWRMLEALGLDVDVCHLNEGHAAFVVLERARCFRERHGVSFGEALWATRAGNVFTTHTPVNAGFDRFPPELIERYFREATDALGLSMPELLGLGRADPRDAAEPFTMAYLALRCCATANGVSRLHGAVSRRLFRGLFPRWPEREVPIGHVTNGVHTPSWDSPGADRLWTEACGKARWLEALEALPEQIGYVPDEALWAVRREERRDLVRYARVRLARQLGQRGAAPEQVADAAQVLDPDALTLGFARRFAPYKRPALLLHDPARLIRLLTRSDRPVQLVIAGKAHPQDEPGKRLVEAWTTFVRRPEVRRHAVFLEDYDMTLAEELVQGVDVWISTPRRPWEACGTSGMKVLVNGGLNVSSLDGWWAEAYTPETGWALGDGQEHGDPDWDARDADTLYRLLEEEIVPVFYARDAAGIPRAWVARVRASMAELAPRFSSNRMLRQYVEEFYRPAAEAVRRRAADGGRLARELHAWATVLAAHWAEVRIDAVEAARVGDDWAFAVRVDPGAIGPEGVRVELYAEPRGAGEPIRVAMDRAAGPAGLGGSGTARVHRARVPASRPASDYTPRVVPHHAEARIPLEAPHIRWPR